MVAAEGKLIVVAGATGRQGEQVVRNLIRQGWRVRALSRTPASKKAARLRQLGAEVAAANLDDPASLEPAFQKAYGLYTVQAPVAGKIEREVRQGQNVAEAARKAGVQHVVYGSAGPGYAQTGIEQWDAKAEVAQAMKTAGLSLTSLRPMAFMELMVDPSYYPASSTWYIWPKLTGWERRIPWISVQDVGAIAAEVFAEPDRFTGQDLPLASDARSLRECRDLYQKVFGKPPPRFPMPLFMFELFVGKDIPNMWRWLRTHEVSLDTGPTYQILPEAMPVETWLRRLKELS